MTETSAPTSLHDLEWYRIMRGIAPVRHSPRTGSWHVYRYEDVAAVLADHRTHSSEVDGARRSGNILNLDPPRHHQLRSLVSKAFSPRAIAAFEPRIAELAEALITGTGGRERVELVHEIARPLPAMVIAELLGVPAEDRPEFVARANALLANDQSRAESGQRWLDEYVRGQVAQRRRAPRDDVLTGLATAEIDGRRLADDEIVGFASLLLSAGHVTTTNLLANAIRCLDEHPEAQDALRADPGRLPVAVEEVIRHRGPVARTSRRTTAAVQVGDERIPAGQTVHLWLVSANHDERRFPDAARFVFDRDPNPHLGFGRGVHFCIGAPLARLETRVTLAALLRRYRHIRVDPDHPLEPFKLRSLNGTRTLHLRVEPAR
jgi:cytochrome P450